MSFPSSPRTVPASRRPPRARAAPRRPERPRGAAARVRARSRRGRRRSPVRSGLDVRSERPGFDPFPQRDLGGDFVRDVARPARADGAAAGAGARQHRDSPGLPRAGHRGESGDAVTGVRYTGDGGKAETLPADLVVDASGREDADARHPEVDGPRAGRGDRRSASISTTRPPCTTSRTTRHATGWGSSSSLRSAARVAP